MGDTSIEWTNKTWNPIRARNRETGGVGHFCEKVSPGCAGCYAERMQKRFKNKIRYNAADRDKVELFLDEKVLMAPLGWREPKLVFPCSMTDLFGSWVPTKWIDSIFAVMSLASQHTFQILTKRSERMRQYMSDSFAPLRVGDCRVKLSKHGGVERQIVQWPFPNVWLGTSVENQPTANERIPLLLQTPAAARFISAEPLLGPINLRELWPDGINFTLDALTGKGKHLLGFKGQAQRLDWVIAGGESGAGARPMHPDWARALRDQCVAAGVPFLFKQWGQYMPLGSVTDESDVDVRAAASADESKSIAVSLSGEVRWRGDEDEIPLPVQEGDGWFVMSRVGKKNAGRLLDGRVWNEMPEAVKGN